MSALRAPFPMERVKYYPKVIYEPKGDRGWSAIVFFYISAEAFCERLDQLFGPGGWKTEIEPVFDKRAVLCKLSVRIGGEWVLRTDIGGERDMAGGDAAANQANAHKSAVSDAIKRCCRQLGMGVYLDDLPTFYHPVVVPDNNKKRAHFDKKNPPRLPDLFLPENERSKKGQQPRQAPAQPTQATQQAPQGNGAARPQAAQPTQQAPQQQMSAEERSRRWRDHLVHLYDNARSQADVAAADAKYSDNIRKLVIKNDDAAILVARASAARRIEEDALAASAPFPG
jgi:hypothetical protein